MHPIDILFNVNIYEFLSDYNLFIFFYIPPINLVLKSRILKLFIRSFEPFFEPIKFTYQKGIFKKKLHPTYFIH